MDFVSLFFSSTLDYRFLIIHTLCLREFKIVIYVSFFFFSYFETLNHWNQFCVKKKHLRIVAWYSYGTAGFCDG
jgi:hypothetical protein